MNQFSGVFIPREVLLDADISASGKIIFAIIQSLDNDKGCFASNEYIGNMLGLSESSVRASIGCLEKKSYITRIIDDAGNRTIKTCVTASFSADTRQKTSDTPPENKRSPRQKTGTYSNRDINSDIKSLMLPPLPHSDGFAKVWEEWVIYRKERKKPLTPSTIKAQLDFLTQLTEQEATDVISKSIQCGWLGLFANTGIPKFQKAKPLTSDDHHSF